MKLRFAASMVVLMFSVTSRVYAADLCQEHLNKAEYDKAIEACTAKITSPAYKPDPVTYHNRGHAYSKKGLYEKAIADYTAALELDPKNERLYHARAAAYESAGQFDKAIGDWSSAVTLAPGENNYVNRARVYRNKGQYDEAIADYGLLIELAPEKASGYWFRAAAYYEKGAFGDSAQDYRKLLQLFAKGSLDVKLDLLYVRLLTSAGKLSKDEYDKVLAELRSYVTARAVSSDDEKWWRTISKYYLGIGGMTETALLDEARNSGDEKKVLHHLCDAYYFIGEKKLKDGDKEGAREFFLKSIDTKVYSYSSRFSTALLRLMQEKKL